ncbi:helix-turn-helix domain-containing protein [Deinococcus aquatilis]|uniref:helix-turn-helix domain-containing protein n=1 Tax=Deinococcus aquatilis TaxID=519440 RepID=UPI000369F91D|nr:helix-turn-helix transcriptional regulator [Deinococcus aquatilis]
MPRLRKNPLPKEASASRLKFAEQLRAERHRQKLTLEDLAERSGLTWSYISQVERGIRNISIDNQDALARGLGVTLKELL